jgi:DNA-binding NarL/FixJ family response regulator
MLAETPAAFRSPRPEASRLLTVAEARRAAGEDDAAGWAEVVEAFRKLEEPYTLAYALMRHADALIMERDPAAAADPLREAHRVTEDLGERPLRAEIEALAQRSRTSLEEAAADAAADPFEMRGITHREQEVLSLLAEGATNREIADALVISEKTASVHVSHILAKLGARNRAEAASIAHRLGLKNGA